MSQCFLITSKRNLQSSEPPYTACPDFYREDPTPKAFGGGVRGAPWAYCSRPSTRLCLRCSFLLSVCLSPCVWAGILFCKLWSVCWLVWLANVYDCEGLAVWRLCPFVTLLSVCINVVEIR
jgi:hypothetical protein